LINNSQKYSFGSSAILGFYYELNSPYQQLNWFSFSRWKSF